MTPSITWPFSHICIGRKSTRLVGVKKAPYSRELSSVLEPIRDIDRPMSYYKTNLENMLVGPPGLEPRTNG